MLTDAWVPPSSLLAKVGGRRSKLGKRFHNELRDARVKAFNSSLILFDMLARARGLRGWPKIIARNQWFQRKVVSFLCSQVSTFNYQPILLSYSYTALEPFRYAKAHGWKTLLVQIDPGPEEEAMVAEETARVPELAGDWKPAPLEYWKEWRNECKLADRIVVNSDWSKECLQRAGVDESKLVTIPLAYEEPQDTEQESEGTRQISKRNYPERFTRERPLRVLFLGQVNLRKGIARLLDAAQALKGEPVEFWIVGPMQITVPETLRNLANIRWFRPSRRNATDEFYQGADVFILPTLSDGFALTQLEAQAYGLPVIASKFCGTVVESGVDGIILEEPSATCIAAAVRDCVGDPERLQKLAAASGVRDKFTIQALAHRLQELSATL